jgi:hypothetical protein
MGAMKSDMRRFGIGVVLFTFISFAHIMPAFAAPLMAHDGTILRLLATDAPGYGDMVSVSSQVRANRRISRSNLYYEIFAPGGTTIVATHSTSLPRMRPGDVYNDSWSTSNSSFPSVGTYTVILCWSTGTSHNCDIDRAQTTFYSVPTMGWGLSLVGLILLFIFLWSHRERFDHVEFSKERARRYDR